MLVADGLGENGAGGLASRVALGSLAHLAIHFGQWRLRVDPVIASELKERGEFFYRRAHAAVVDRARTHPALSGMATTVTAAYSAGTDLFTAHVGHSRAYLFRDGGLTQLTRDHTLAWHLENHGGLAAVDPATRDLQHILTETIGGQSQGPLVDVDHVQIVDGDAVLLCTNGLTDAVSDDQIADVLAFRRAAAEQCRLLIDLAIRAGTRDNVTMTLMQYDVP
jgi:protein phosphatase